MSAANAGFEYLDFRQTAWQRRVRVAVEVSDAATGELIREGIDVRVKGLRGQSVVSTSGRFVWFDEPGATPLEVDVDPGRLPFLPQTSVVPPASVPARDPQASTVLIALVPTAAYPFGAGGGAASGIRGTLVRDGHENPAVPLADRALWLQWMDENLALPGWTDSPIRTRTDDNGDFAAIVRLGPKQIARLDAKRAMRVRLAVDNGGIKHSNELATRPGCVSNLDASLGWDSFN